MALWARGGAAGRGTLRLLQRAPATAARTYATAPPAAPPAAAQPELPSGHPQPQPQPQPQPPKLTGWKYALAKATAVSLGLETRSATAVRRAQSMYGPCARAAQQSGAFYVKTCQLPNTFQTWFSVTQLHLWMIIARLRRDGQDGQAAASALVDAFISDIELRMGALGVARIDASLKVLVAQMYGMSLAYDEGIVGDDATLYAALWRNMTDMQGAPHAVALLTQYVRREVARLDALPVEDLYLGRFQWHPPAESLEV